MESSSSPRQQPPSRLGDVLQALNLAASAVRLYPDPEGQPPFVRAIEILQASVSQGPIRVEVGPTHFAAFPAGNPGIDALCKALFEREVLHLAIIETPSSKDLLAFGNIVSMDPGELAGVGGAGRYLTERNVTTIAIELRDFVVTDPAALHGRPRDETAPGGPELDLSGPAEEVYGRLHQEHGRARELDEDMGAVEGRIADSVASMSSEDRYRLLDIAFENMPDQFATAITGQLSDSELVDALVWLSSSRGTGVVLAYAAAVVAQSGGRRKELPGMLSEQLSTTREVIGEAGVKRLLGSDVSERIQSAQEIDSSSIKAEADDFISGSKEELTLRLVRGLTETSVSEDALASAAEQVLASWATQGYFEKIVDLISIFLDEDGRFPFARERLLDAAACESVVTAAMDGSSDSARKLLDMSGPRAIPLLVHHLATEPHRHRRKILMDTISALASIDHRPALASLEDHRWFLVRNMVTVLSKAAPSQTVGRISKLTVHPDARVRREVVRALSVSGGDEHLPAVARSLADHDASVRLAAIAGLGSIDTESAVNMLKEVATSKSRTSRERKEALTSLSMTSRNSARTILEQTARRRWPPGTVTRDLATHASSLLERFGRSHER